MDLKKKLIGAGITTLLMIGGGIGRIYQKRKARKEAELEKDVREALSKRQCKESENLKEFVRLMESDENYRNSIMQSVDQMRRIDPRLQMEIAMMIDEAFRKAQIEPDEETLDAIDRIFKDEDSLKTELAIVDP